eukprot:7036171-Pyramimonas_sp.AAC.1
MPPQHPFATWEEERQIILSRAAVGLAQLPVQDGALGRRVADRDRLHCVVEAVVGGPSILQERLELLLVPCAGIRRDHGDNLTSAQDAIGRACPGLTT